MNNDDMPVLARIDKSCQNSGCSFRSVRPGRVAKMAGNLLRLMQSLLPAGAGMTRGAAWQPSADIYQTRQGWLVKFDLAGVKPPDVHLSVEDNHLIIRGMRRDLCVEEGYSCY